MDGLLSQVRLQLERDLEKICMEEQNTLYAAKKSLVVIRDCCRQLSTLRVQCEFKTKDEEIYFFKELKCYYYSLLFYNQDIIEILGGIPNGSKEAKQNFLKECLHKLNDHFINNRNLYTYYRVSETNHDYQYFSLIKRHDSKFDDQGRNMFCDDDYSSSHDLLYSRVISNDRIEKYLHHEIDKLNGVESLYGNQNNRFPKKHFQWTESKAALIELLYALHGAKCINEGKTDIKELVILAQSLFPNLELGDFYRTYIDLKNRSQRSKFLDALKMSLLERLDNDDEKDYPNPNSIKKK
jgi:hypothetical protein